MLIQSKTENEVWAYTRSHVFRLFYALHYCKGTGGEATAGYFGLAEIEQFFVESLKSKIKKKVWN